MGEVSGRGLGWVGSSDLGYWLLPSQIADGSIPSPSFSFSRNPRPSCVHPSLPWLSIQRLFHSTTSLIRGSTTAFMSYPLSLKQRPRTSSRRLVRTKREGQGRNGMGKVRPDGQADEFQEDKGAKEGSGS